MITDTTFAGHMAQRTAAMTAFVKADSSLRLRRALLRKHTAMKGELAVGQRCYYWRDALAGRLQKVRWKGPATVVMKEANAQGKTTVYWLVHGTSLSCDADLPTFGRTSQTRGMHAPTIWSRPSHSLDARRRQA